MPHPCCARAVYPQCRAAKGLECVLPIWFTQCGHVWFTLATLWPCCSSQGHGTARPLRDGLWATWPHSASSSYHAVFHEGCYQKHANPPHKDPYLWLLEAHYKKDDLLNCWTSSLDISGYHASFHYGHSSVRAWQGNSMGAALSRNATCESDFNRPENAEAEPEERVNADENKKEC